ncbi:MAG: anti-sigma factor [Chthoniobacterales bacterium]
MNEDLEDQAALYALDLLEGDERSAFEARLGREPELSALVDALRESAASLAHTTPPRQPPPFLEEKIMAAIRTHTPHSAVRSIGSSWLPWALAACLAIACVVLAADRAKIKNQVARLEQRNAFAQLRLATLASQLASAPNASAALVWDGSKQEGVLKVTNVPANEENRDYQLWIVDPDYKNPVDAGVFHLAQNGAKEIPFKPKEHIKSASGFAVSLERKGGVEKAEGPMVLLGK